MKARPAGECYGSRSCRTAPVCPGVRLCARAARPPAPRPSAGGAPAPAALRLSAGGRLCARAALRVLPRHAYAPRAAAPAQSYWQNATSFFVWYTVSTNCRSSGESV